MARVACLLFVVSLTHLQCYRSTIMDSHRYRTRHHKRDNDLKDDIEKAHQRLISKALKLQGAILLELHPTVQKEWLEFMNDLTKAQTLGLDAINEIHEKQKYIDRMKNRLDESYVKNEDLRQQLGHQGDLLRRFIAAAPKKAPPPPPPYSVFASDATIVADHSETECIRSSVGGTS